MATLIEWVKSPDGDIPGETFNPITGCLRRCSYCYAWRLANGRLRDRYLAPSGIPCPSPDGDQHMPPSKSVGDPFWPRFWPEKAEQIAAWGRAHAKPGHHPRRGVFLCDMSDLFGPWVPPSWIRYILDGIRADPLDRFYLLTKHPEGLLPWRPFPENVYIGVTVTNEEMMVGARRYLPMMKPNIRFISFEPLQEDVVCLHQWRKIPPDMPEEPADLEYFCDRCQRHALLPSKEPSTLFTNHYPICDWVIIGAQTNPQILPDISWVRNIEAAAKEARIPVFHKNNMRDLLLAHGETLRQEMP